jgi:hypothetical protein
MQHIASFGIVAAVVVIAALAIALGFVIAAPILAVPFFIVGFGAFLVWRGRQRAGTGARAGIRERYGDRVPTTEETAADPVRDSSIPDATASGTAGRHRADAPGL